MKLLSLIAAASGVASVAAGNVPFTLCESGDPVTIENISVDPTPAPGATLKLSATGKSTVTINDGTFTLVAKYLGIPVINQSGDICNDPELKLNCPVAANTEADVLGSFTIPKDAPPGAYTLEVHAKDAAGNKLFCADINIKMAAATTFSSTLEKSTLVLADDFKATTTTHYEDPKASGSCESGEMAVQIQGVAGDFCSPSCTFAQACPTDVPTGTTATPMCALAAGGSSSPTNCALICTPGANAGCPANASCKSISGVGICTYDD